MSINIIENRHNVIVEEDRIRVVAVAQQGPPGPAGPPGDADMSMYDDHLSETDNIHGISNTAELETQSGAQDKVDAHNAATNVHGVDTTQLATQDDLANLEPLPEPGDDGDVLTLADGSPTWATPSGGGGGGLDPSGEETITGDWLFDREDLRVGQGTNVGIGLNTSSGSSNSTVLGFGAGAANTGGTAIGDSAQARGGGAVAVGRTAGPTSGLNNGQRSAYIGWSSGRSSISPFSVMVGAFSGQDSSVSTGIYVGRAAGRNNTRANRLIIDAAATDTGNLVDPLIDGRFRDGTDSDSFEYSKGVKINGHLEATDQLILRSPNGTRWAITVDDSGNLSTTEATEAITP